MAFRRKDVKKASYYVWFLGAKESKGLRGDEYVVPVLRFLLDKERQFEPSKVTLQVSNKGLKIVQTLNVPRKSGNNSVKSTTTILSTTSPKTEQIKHIIPHHSVTWVSQEEDIICCIMLIYNPITKCPVHVHAYRCDSIETATTLRNQLQILIDRPENQKKFREIELRLAAKGLMPTTGPVPPGMEFAPRRPLLSDGRSTRTEGSDNTDDSLGSSDLGYNGKEPKSNKIHQSENNGQISTLYESLAAELRAKLGNPKTGPILLPPRDYDTISRKRGKLEGIELRKSTNKQIVGPLEQNVSPITRSESSGKSSGIGSDEALSSAIQEIHPDYDRKTSEISSDEEDWIVERQRQSSHGDHRDHRDHHRDHWSSPKTVQNEKPTMKVSQPQPIAHKFKWTDRNYDWDEPSPPSLHQIYHHQSPPHQKPSSQPQRYYFPDPAFSVPDAQQSSSRSEQRLQRRQSNPDYFHQIRSVSPHAGRSPPAYRPLDKQASYKRNGLSPDQCYAREEIITKYRESTEPRKDYNNRRSFVETPMTPMTPMRRIAPQNY